MWFNIKYNMKLFFGQIFPDLILDLDEQLHITKVLRMREGEEIFVTDGNGNLAKGNLVFEGKNYKRSSLALPLSRQTRKD
jgi:16S rRNA U1498 N3-methylase RsmE